MVDKARILHEFRVWSKSQERDGAEVWLSHSSHLSHLVSLAHAAMRLRAIVAQDGLATRCDFQEK